MDFISVSQPLACPPDTQDDALQLVNSNTMQLSLLLAVLQCEVLSVEKASMASGLEAKDAQMERMQQEHSNVQTQLLLCQERVSQLQSELVQVCPHCFCSSAAPRKGNRGSEGLLHPPSIPYFTTGDLCTLGCLDVWLLQLHLN